MPLKFHLQLKVVDVEFNWSIERRSGTGDRGTPLVKRCLQWTGGLQVLHPMLAQIGFKPRNMEDKKNKVVLRVQSKFPEGNHIELPHDTECGL